MQRGEGQSGGIEMLCHSPYFDSDVAPGIRARRYEEIRLRDA